MAEGFPKPGCSLGQLQPQTWVVSSSWLLTTHVPRVFSQSLLSLNKVPLRTSLWISLVGGSKVVTEAFLRATQSWDFVFASGCILWVSEQRLSCLGWDELLSLEFQVPLCSPGHPTLVLYLLWWCRHHCGWPILCRGHSPPPPYTHYCQFCRNSPGIKSGVGAIAGGSQRVL